MLSDRERREFEQIVAEFGPLTLSRMHRIPWWLLPASLLLGGLLCSAAAVAMDGGALGGLGYLAEVAALAWAAQRHRLRRARAAPVPGTRPLTGQGPAL